MRPRRVLFICAMATTGIQTNARRRPNPESLNTHQQQQAMADLVARFKQEVAINPAKINREIGRSGITDQRALFEIAEISARLNGSDLSDCIGNYRITDQVALGKLAILSLTQQTGEHVCKFIENFGIKDPGILREVAEVAAAHHPASFIFHFKNFGFTDRATKLALVLIAAKHDGKATSECIPLCGIEDVADRIEIARASAAQNGEGTSRHITNYGISDIHELTEIARIALSQNIASWASLSRYSLPPDTERQLVTQAFTTLGATLRTGTTWTQQSTQGLRQTLEFTRLVDRDQRFLPEPLKPYASCNNWDKLEPRDRLRILASALANYVDCFDKTILAWDVDLDAEELSEEAFALTLLTWKSADVEKYGSRAQAALAVFSGYDDLPNVTTLSSTAIRELWGGLVTAYELLGGPPAALIPVAFTNYEQARRVVTLAATLKSLGGDLPLFKSEVSSDEDLVSLSEQLLTAISQSLVEALGLQHLSNDQIAKLLEKFGGDLSPLPILAARFSKGPPLWQQELVLLRELIEQTVSDTFVERRYRREDGQLVMLDDQQVLQWRENPHSLVLEHLGEAGSFESVIASVQDRFDTNLRQYLPLPTESARSVDFRQELLEISQMTEKQFTKKVTTISEAMAILEQALASQDAQCLIRVMRLINSTKAALLRKLPGADDQQKQISKQLNLIKQSVDKLTDERDNAYYVLSTITDDLKLSLMTGDLVQAGSCQNSESGSRIDSLLSNSVDGNIKLALSYVIKKTTFDMVRARLPNAEFTTMFDAPRQELIIHAGGTSTRLALERPLRREVLRLGQSADGRAVLLRERPYLQRHAIEKSIEARLTDLIGSVRNRVGLEVARGGDHYPASRNVAGTYTDTGRGPKVGPYTLPGNGVSETLGDSTSRSIGSRAVAAVRRAWIAFTSRFRR
jgi:hypothetical protein